MSEANDRGPVANIPLVSVVMPCLNEEEAIGSCIEKIRQTFATANIDGEIIVCDNGSTDRSAEIAEDLGFAPERLQQLAALLALACPVLLGLGCAVGRAGRINIRTHLLDGYNGATAPGVFRLIHSAHTATANDAQNPVAAA